MNLLINFTRPCPVYAFGDVEMIQTREPAFPHDPMDLLSMPLAFNLEMASLDVAEFGPTIVTFAPALPADLLRALGAAADQMHKTIKPAPAIGHETDIIYGVHIKSVLLRLLGRWATLSGAPNCNLINPPVGTPVFQDLCELFNYPAVLTKEERYSFSPAHIDSVLGITSGSSTEAAWNLAKRFVG